LPPDLFDIHLFCFDTSVYETTLKSREIFGNGGTYFHIIEPGIQRYMMKYNKKYPEAVFLITDGYGDKVYPKYPERWHWFLTNSYKTYIPLSSKTYNLKDYE
jgi:hypothetical protein